MFIKEENGSKRGVGGWEGGIRVAWTRVGSTGWRDQVRFRIYVTVKPTGCSWAGCGPWSER